jgi:hypothetical protein
MFGFPYSGIPTLRTFKKVFEKTGLNFLLMLLQVCKQLKKFKQVKVELTNEKRKPIGNGCTI